METLRSRWKLALLLVVLFLVGVGIGSTGESEAEPAAATARTVTVGGETVTEQVTVTDAVTETVEEIVTTVKTKTVVKPPPSSGVKVAYGEWRGLFKIHGARIVSQYGLPSVIGQFEYLGGGDCQLGYVEVSGTFFDRGGRIVSTGLWNTTTAPKGARLPLEMVTLDEVPATRAELVVTGATCD